MQLQGTGSRKGCVPGGPFARVMLEWLEKESQEIEDDPFDNLCVSPMVRLKESLGMDINNLRKIKNGNREWIGFDIADKIVAVCTDGLGWRNDPELRAIYKAFDFDWLDQKKPCVSTPCVS